MRDVRDRYGFGYWSAAFRVVMGKHGWRDVDLAEPSVLEEVEDLEAYDALIVAWLPDDTWKPSYLASLRAYDGAIFLEGPLPAMLDSFVGVRPLADREPLTEGQLSPAGWLARHWPRGGADEPESVTLAPKEVALSASQVAPRANGGPPLAARTDELGVLARETALSYIRLYRDRLREYGTVFEDREQNALALMAAARLRRVEIGTDREVDAFIDEMVSQDRPRSGRPSTTPAGERKRRIAEVLWSLALVTVGETRGDPGYVKQAAEWLRRSALELDERETSPEVVSLRACAGSMLDPAHERQPMGAGEDADPAWAAWLFELARSGFADSAPRPVDGHRDWLDTVSEALDGGSESLPPILDDWNVPELLALAAALGYRDRARAADWLARSVLEQCRDAGTGRLRAGYVSAGRLRTFATHLLTPVAPLALAEVTSAPPGSATFPGGSPRAWTGCSDACRDAWAKQPFWVEPYETEDAVDELVFVTAEGPLAGVWRKGRSITTSFQLLAHVVHAHTLHPPPAPAIRSHAGDAAELEMMLFHLLGALTARHDRLPVPGEDLAAAAAGEGLASVELPVPCVPRPYRGFPWLTEEGEVRVENVLVVPVDDGQATAVERQQPTEPERKTAGAGRVLRRAVRSAALVAAIAASGAAGFMLQGSGSSHDARTSSSRSSLGGTQMALVRQRLAGLNRARVAGRRRLVRAGDRITQARAALRLSEAFHALARALEDSPARTPSGAYARLIASARTVARAYSALAIAAKRGEPGAYREASRRLRREEQALAALLRSLAR
jgi:hypothetical protein